MSNEQEIITEKQWEKLTIQLAKGQGEKGFTDDDVVKVGEWAKMATINYELLKMVLKGKLIIRIGDTGDLEFKKEGDKP